MISAHGVEAVVEDLRTSGVLLPTEASFEGVLHGPQIKAFDALAPHDTGVLGGDDSLWQDGRGRRAHRRARAKYA